MIPEEATIIGEPGPHMPVCVVGSSPRGWLHTPIPIRSERDLVLLGYPLTWFCITSEEEQDPKVPSKVILPYEVQEEERILIYSATKDEDGVYFQKSKLGKVCVLSIEGKELKLSLPPGEEILVTFFPKMPVGDSLSILRKLLPISEKGAGPLFFIKGQGKTGTIEVGFPEESGAGAALCVASADGGRGVSQTTLQFKEVEGKPKLIFSFPFSPLCPKAVYHLKTSEDIEQLQLDADAKNIPVDVEFPFGKDAVLDAGLKTGNYILSGLADSGRSATAIAQQVLEIASWGFLGACICLLPLPTPGMAETAAPEEVGVSEGEITS